MEMTEERAREILKRCHCISFLPCGGFETGHGTIYYSPGAGPHAKIDGIFTSDELEAIAFLMRSKGDI